MNPKQDRNARVFAGVLAGSSFAELASEHRVSEARIEQIFKAEARRQYPQIVAAVAGGQGFRARFWAALNAQGGAA